MARGTGWIRHSLKWAGLGALLLGCVAAGCGGGELAQRLQPAQPVAELPPAAADLAALPVPRAGDAAAAYDDGYGDVTYRSGANCDIKLLPAHNVAFNEGAADFMPAWQAGSGATDMAYAMYVFRSQKLPQPLQLRMTWDATPQLARLWIGMANLADKHWDWFFPCQVYDNTVFINLPNQPEYCEADGTRYLLVALLGTDQRSLQSLSVKTEAPVIREIRPTYGKPQKLLGIHALVEGTEPLAYAWDFGGGAEPNLSDQAFPVVRLGEVGRYKCSLTISNNAGRAEQAFELIVGLPVVLDVSPGGGTQDQPLTLSAEVQSPTEEYSLSWSLGEGLEPAESAELNPAVTPRELGRIWSTVTVTNEYGSTSRRFDLISLVKDEDLPADTLLAVPVDTRIPAGSEALVVVYTGVMPYNAFAMGVAIILEDGVTLKGYDPGTPYVGYSAVNDGIWADYGLPGYFWRECIYGYAPADCAWFCAPLIGATGVQGEAGALFNCRLRFDQAGTYRLEFVKVVGVTRTYYEEYAAVNHCWSDISNAVPGLPNTIEVYEP